MQYFVKDNKCFRSVIRGTVKVDSVAAGATELVTLKFDEELSADSVCMVTAQEYPRRFSFHPAPPHDFYGMYYTGAHPGNQAAAGNK